VKREIQKGMENACQVLGRSHGTLAAVSLEELQRRKARIQAFAVTSLMFNLNLNISLADSSLMVQVYQKMNVPSETHPASVNEPR
jgi:hypothetical protein